MNKKESRYARQIACRQIGEKGQKAIRSARILQVGCGALGSVQAELLTRAGVGQLVIVDSDCVELSNLQRQILFDEEDAENKRPKAQAAATRLSRINHEVIIEPHVLRITPDNISSFVRNADLVMDATDNFETRFLMNDTCVESGIPFVYGGVLGTDGTVMPVLPGRGPCLRCLVPCPPDPSTLLTIREVGVLSTTVNLVASQQVTLALSILVNPELTDTAVRVFDVWEGQFRRVPLKRNEKCPTCSRFMKG